MKNLVFVLVALLLGLGSFAQAQMIDHWSTSQECIAASSSPFYYPSDLTHKRKLGKNEVVRGHPTGGCFFMVLPDREVGRAWVRINDGRKFVYDRTTGKILRLEECGNDTPKWVPFPPLKGAMGPRGPEGPRGRDALNYCGDSSAENFGEEETCLYPEEKPKKRGHKLRNTLLILGVLGGGSYAAWYYSCPPGTSRKR